MFYSLEKIFLIIFSKERFISKNYVQINNKTFYYDFMININDRLK